MKKTKVFAAYLPQFHEIEENNLFWGKGFTDWEGVKKATPQYKGHRQPILPQNKFFYDLSDYRIIQNQAKLAKEYGIDGFCIYHYWFKNGKQVLQKPAELILEHKEIEITYFFSWDNGSWVRSWSNISGNSWAPKFDQKKDKEESPYLLELDYGDEKEWKKHFYYLLPFFRDKRYAKIDEKPIFVFFSDKNPKILQQMEKCWKQLAVENGLNGLYLIVQKAPFIDKHIFDATFIYQPLAQWNKKHVLQTRIKRLLKINKVKSKLKLIDYDKAWKKIIHQAKKCKNKNIFYSGLVRYDDTPRRGNRANIFINGSPDKFENYIRELYQIACRDEKEILFLTAWNEWGEGAYLEADEQYGLSYLESFRRAKLNISEDRDILNEEQL